MEFIEQIRQLGLLADSDKDYGVNDRISLYEGLEVNERDLKLHLHLYIIHTGAENTPTA